MQYLAGHQQLRCNLLVRQYPHHTPGIGSQQHLAQKHWHELGFGLAYLGKDTQLAVAGLIKRDTRVKNNQTHVEHILLGGGAFHLQADIAADRRRCQGRCQLGPGCRGGHGQYATSEGDRAPPPLHRHWDSVVHTLPREIVILQL